MALLMSSSVSAPRWRTPASVPWSFSESESNNAPAQGTLPRAVELDLLVIGSGPGGQSAAIQAAKLGKRVAVAERRNRLGGVSIHTGTIPSKTLRQAALEQLATRPLDVLDPTRVEETEQPGDRAAARPRGARGRGRDRGHARAVPPQPRRLLPGRRRFEDANTVRIEAPTSRSARAGS